ncbi:hypothetical protein [Sutcliffiella cohnii]|uniref:hypothetical protein n=1 Tax=Sutcliffiella cohnii TaxID=33932 RepID=UPI002E24374D|nr:hypothetical protein [Sutcliffiella cohnii]
MKRLFLLFNLSFALMFLTVACNQQPEIDISKAVDRTEEYFRELNEVSTTAAVYSEEQVKFRLMVEKHPSVEEATAMFNTIIDKLEKNSNTPEFWNYYNGNFDIKSYDEGVIFEATKVIGQELKVTQK